MTKLPCCSCGALILPTTFEKNKGRCLPCADGAKLCTRCGSKSKHGRKMSEGFVCYFCLRPKTSAPEPELVKFRGREMAAGWPEKIREAQLCKQLEMKGQYFDRLPYAAKKSSKSSMQNYCADCAVDPGELHVYTCDQEVCPNCLGQLLSCACPMYLVKI